MPEPIELTLFADYHQIHVFDEGSRTDLGEAWTERASADGLAVGADAMAISTTVNVDVLVAVEILDGPPDDDHGTFEHATFDHVVEGSLRCSSGRLVVMGCTDFEPEARRFPVPAGWLRLRACRSNLDAAYEADIDSDEDPATMERMRLRVWPAPAAPASVLRRWRPPAE